jgi:hypothetical protein
MSLYRRKQAGIWYADFYDGKSRSQFSTGTANRREAEKILALRLSEVERGEYSKPVKITFAELGEQYMDYAKAKAVVVKGSADSGAPQWGIRDDVAS